MPVLVLTARGAWTERVEGIDAGADDYLPKPFHMEELVARARSLVRRAAGQRRRHPGRRPARHRRQPHDRDRSSGVPLALSALEYRLLAYLVLHRDAGRAHRPSSSSTSTATTTPARRTRSRRW